MFLDYFSKLLWTSCILHCAVLLFDDQYPNFWCVQIFHLCQTRKLCNDRQTLASWTCLALLPVATDGVQRLGRVQRLKRLELGFCTFGFYLFVICILLGCCLHLFWGREYFVNLFQMWVKAWLESREVRCLWYLRCKHNRTFILSTINESTVLPRELHVLRRLKNNIKSSHRSTNAWTIQTSTTQWQIHLIKRKKKMKKFIMIDDLFYLKEPIQPQSSNASLIEIIIKVKYFSVWIALIKISHCTRHSTEISNPTKRSNRKLKMLIKNVLSANSMPQVKRIKNSDAKTTSTHPEWHGQLIWCKNAFDRKGQQSCLTGSWSLHRLHTNMPNESSKNRLIDTIRKTIIKPFGIPKFLRSDNKPGIWTSNEFYKFL